jgi:hypothetical protein
VPITDPKEFAPPDPTKYQRQMRNTLDVLGRYNEKHPGEDLTAVLNNLLALIQVGFSETGKSMEPLVRAISELVRDKENTIIHSDN